MDHRDTAAKSLEVRIILKSILCVIGSALYGALCGLLLVTLAYRPDVETGYALMAVSPIAVVPAFVLWPTIFVLERLRASRVTGILAIVLGCIAAGASEAVYVSIKVPGLHLPPGLVFTFPCISTAVLLAVWLDLPPNSVPFSFDPASRLARANAWREWRSTRGAGYSLKIASIVVAGVVVGFLILVAGACC